MHLTSHITHSNGYAPYIAYYRSNGFDQRFRKLKPKPKLNPPNAHRSKFAKRGKRKMCSFGSCQTRFEFLSHFRKVRNAFECFVTQVQTRLPKTKCVWPMKINVICTVGHYLYSFHAHGTRFSSLSIRTISNGPIAFKFYTEVKYLKLHTKQGQSLD